MPTLVNSNVSMGYASEEIFGEPPYERYRVTPVNTLEMSADKVKLKRITDKEIFSTYSVGQPVWVKVNGVDYEFGFDSIITETNGSFSALLTPSTNIDLVAALAGNYSEWYILPEFTQICFKAGGIQRAAESAEAVCLSDDGQVANKQITGFTVTTTLETNYTGTDFAKNAIASVLHGEVKYGSTLNVTGFTGSKLFDPLTNLYTYTFTGGSSMEVGQPFIIKGTSQKLATSGIFYVDSVGVNNFTFKTTRNFEVTDLSSWSLDMFDTVKNGTKVSSFNLVVANEALKYYKGLRGAVIHSLDLSSPSNELVTMNFGALCGGDFYISPTTTDPTEIGTPPYSKLVKDNSIGLPFIGSKSFLYLNGKVYPVSEFTLKTGETYMVEKSGRTSEEHNDALYPNKISVNNLSQIGGTFKSFLDDKTLRLIMASANSCVANLFVVLQSVKGCEGSNGKTQYLTIHLPSVTLIANDDNPALNTPTAVNVEFSAGKSNMGYTVMFGMYACA